VFRFISEVLWLHKGNTRLLQLVTATGLNLENNEVFPTNPVLFGNNISLYLKSMWKLVYPTSVQHEKTKVTR